MKEAYVIQLVLIIHLHNVNWTILYNSPASIPFLLILLLIFTIIYSPHHFSMTYVPLSPYYDLSSPAVSILHPTLKNS